MKLRVYPAAVALMAGVAAFTAGGPSAFAASAAHGGVSTKAISASVTQCANNVSGTKNWVHLYTTVTPGPVCVGGTGNHAISGGDGQDYGFCGGNNYGHINAIVNGTAETIPFHQGTTIALPNGGAVFTITNVYIAGWSGTQTCPYPG